MTAVVRPASMEITTISLHRLLEIPHDFDAVVAIDVLRSFSTAAYAFAAGVTEIYPIETASEAARLSLEIPLATTIGALPGGHPIPGFDLGNSPSRLTPEVLRNRPAILTTAAGVRALARFRRAPLLFAASLVCAQATVSALLAAAPRRVALVTTGEWIDRDGDEDIACADYLAAGLLGKPIDIAGLERRVRESDFGRRFAAGLDPSLPSADLELCAIANRFDFAMPVTREGGHMVIRPLLTTR